MRLLAALVRFLIVFLNRNVLDVRDVKTILLEEKNLRVYMPSNRGDILQVQNILSNLPEEYEIKLYINSIQRPYIFESGLKFEVIENWYTTSPYLPFSSKRFPSRQKKIDQGFTIALKPSIEMLTRRDIHYINLIEFENLIFSIIKDKSEGRYMPRLKSGDLSKGKVLVAPSASWKFRKLDKYINVIEAQLTNRGKRVSFLLSKSELRTYKEQGLSINNIYFFEDFEGKEQWDVFLSNFEYTITSDSIALHLCNYLKKPVICIFGPSKFIWNHNFFFDGVDFIESSNKCSPCRQLFCHRVVKRGSCLKDSIDRVILK